MFACEILGQQDSSSQLGRLHTTAHPHTRSLLLIGILKIRDHHGGIFKLLQLCSTCSKGGSQWLLLGSYQLVLLLPAKSKMMSRERNDKPNVAELAADAEEKLWE